MSIPEEWEASINPLPEKRHELPYSRSFNSTEVASRDEVDAELIIEVDRKLFTDMFVYSVIDPKTNRVLLGRKICSLGGTVEGQIANGFVKQLP